MWAAWAEWAAAAQPQPPQPGSALAVDEVLRDCANAQGAGGGASQIFSAILDPQQDGGAGRDASARGGVWQRAAAGAGGGGAGCAGPAGPTCALAVAALAAARAAERARGNVAVDRLPPLVALAHVVHARTTARAVVWALPLGAALTGPQVIAVADALLAARAVATAVVRARSSLARSSLVPREAVTLACVGVADAGV